MLQGHFPLLDPTVSQTPTTRRVLFFSLGFHAHQICDPRFDNNPLVYGVPSAVLTSKLFLSYRSSYSPIASSKTSSIRPLSSFLHFFSPTRSSPKLLQQWDISIMMHFLCMEEFVSSKAFYPSFLHASRTFTRQSFAISSLLELSTP